MLERLGYRIISIKPISRFLPDISKLIRRRVDTFEFVIFTRQLALLLESGVGIVRSLELLQQQTGDRGLKKVLGQVVVDIRRGESLSAAMEKHSSVFPKMYCRMIAVGEQGGGLEAVLRNLADFMEKQTAAMKKLKSAMTYPIIVAIVAVIVGIVMVTFLLPAIVNLFSALGGELPLQTRLLLWLMDGLSKYGLYLMLMVVLLAVVVFLYVRTKKGRYKWDKLTLRIPMLGRIFWLNELSRFCRSLALLFRTGIPLPEALLLTAQTSKNSVLIQNLNEIQREMLHGEGLAGPIRKRSIFLPLMAEMAKVGEETGHLDTALSTVADSFEVESDRRTQTMLSMIEPVMTIVIGLAVGLLAISVIGPIYDSLKLVGGS
jgi:type IV pilus assembly protein PilC